MSEYAAKQAEAIDKSCEFGCGCFRINGQWARRCEAHRDGGKMHHFKDGLKGTDGNAVVPRGLLDEASAAYGKEFKKRRGDPMAEQNAMISALKVAVEQCAERADQDFKDLRAGLMKGFVSECVFPNPNAPTTGISYRQWLVGQIVAGVYATPDRGYKDAVLDDWRKKIAVSAVQQADAIIAELMNPTPKEKP